MNPTVGRIVHYFPDPGEENELHETVGNPLAAIVVTVFNETCVNLTVFDANGETHSRTSVGFTPDGSALGIGGYASWPERAEG